jgi:hypothetical protein
MSITAVSSRHRPLISMERLVFFIVFPPSDIFPENGYIAGNSQVCFTPVSPENQDHLSDVFPVCKQHQIYTVFSPGTFFNFPGSRSRRGLH